MEKSEYYIDIDGELRDEDDDRIIGCYKFVVHVNDHSKGTMSIQTFYDFLVDIWS